MVSDDAQVGALVVVSVLSVVASVTWQCSQRSLCAGRNTCSAMRDDAHDGGRLCKFTNAVPSTSTWLYFNTSAFVDLSRSAASICRVGERLHLSPATGRATCKLLRPYPNALHVEIMDRTAASDHDRACGAWLHDASGPPRHATGGDGYLAFADGAERAAAVEAAEAASYASAKLGSKNIGKFRASCERALLGGGTAIRFASTRAYWHLLATARVEEVSDVTSGLHALGVLAGHYCDAPVVFGRKMVADGYATSARQGRRFASADLVRALQLVGVTPRLALESATANDWMNANAPPFASEALVEERVLSVLNGATGRASRETASLSVAGDIPQLASFGHAANASIARARAYLRGVAALCAASLDSLLPTQMMMRDGTRRARAATRNPTSRPPAVALGHLRAPPHRDFLFDVDEQHEVDASMITLSQIATAPADTPTTACLAFTRAIFPDDVDEIQFGLVVSAKLYARMERVVARVRAGVATVLRTNARIRAVLHDADAVAVDVEATRIRIPGAPRGTWAGPDRAPPQARFASSEGVFVHAAKQARAVFLDRQGSLAHDATGPCEAPAAFYALVQNAYVYPQYRCAYYLLGMSRRPFADEAYDDASLVARFGYLIGQ